MGVFAEMGSTSTTGWTIIVYVGIRLTDLKHSAHLLKRIDADNLRLGDKSSCWHWLLLPWARNRVIIGLQCAFKIVLRMASKTGSCETCFRRWHIYQGKFEEDDGNTEPVVELTADPSTYFPGSPLRRYFRTVFERACDRFVGWLLVGMRVDSSGEVGEGEGVVERIGCLILFIETPLPPPPQPVNSNLTSRWGTMDPKVVRLLSHLATALTPEKGRNSI